jgi:A-macroglobulin TED domain/Alpha-2-macroglobulin family/Carboxypeptidase regulatory-like domain/MG2 domain/A-macroglobulin receptor binding domain
MIRSRLSELVGLFLIFDALTAFAAERVTIDESKIRIEIAGTATLKLPVTNTTDQPISTALRLEFLAPDDSVQNDVLAPVMISPGSTVLTIPVPGLLKLERFSIADYGWLRLRYVLPDDAYGIVSVSSIAREPFVLRVIRPNGSVPGAPYRIQVLAHDPESERPVANVEVAAKLVAESDSTQTTTRSRGRTNSAGYAQLDFELPKLPPDTDVDLEVTGRLGNFVRRASDSITLSNDLAVLITTDKPIYQPGQMLRVRALAFDALRRAAKGIPLDITIWDPGHDKVFQASLMTSTFGEAHSEWSIPENGHSGSYEVRVESEDSVDSSRFIWVSRYDLPNFTIDVHPNRPYYMPGQNAELDLKADYLFGKPLPLAPLKIVREIHRSWNYRESKWDVENGEVIEGVTDREGRFHSTLNLGSEQSKLSDDSRRLYEDLSYGVYVTDPSTGRTEERRFWIRITTYPIHVRFLQPVNSPNLPLEFYVLASYADGSPITCEVEVFEVVGNVERYLGTVRTNKFGLGKVIGLKPSPDWLMDDRYSQLAFRTRDSAGLTGQSRDYAFLHDDIIRVHTVKTLFNASESILADVEATVSTGPVVLNVSKDGQILYSAVLQLLNGKASTRIPYSRAFRGDILLSAYYPGGVKDSMFGGRQISFPTVGGLEIESSASKPSYSPGEEATLSFRVRNGDGSPQESLLGITVLDKAVEERARTDSEFGSESVCPRCAVFLGWDLQLPGITRADLDRVDRTRQIPAELDLAAEVMLSGWDRYGNEPQEVDDAQLAQYVFAQRLQIQKRFDQFRMAGQYPSGFDLPRDEETLHVLMLRVDPEFDGLRDPWNSPYRLESSFAWDQNQIKVVSSGPDKRFRTADDFPVAWLRWNSFEDYKRILAATLSEYHKRTGGYIRDGQTLRDELRKRGQDFDAWSDPSGHPYSAEFGIQLTDFTTTIKSKDRVVFTVGVDYTGELRSRIDQALNRFVSERDSVPETDAELRTTLERAGMSDTDLQDPWGRRYYSVIKNESGYFDSVTVLAGVTDVSRIVPVTREAQVIRLRSAGPDGVEGTEDDFTTVSFLRPVREQSVTEANARVVESPFLDSTRGAIHGSVTDSTGALIPGASVKVTGGNERDFDLISEADGAFFLRNLEPGVYQIRLSLPGFTTKVLTGVRVRAGAITQVVGTLEVASLNSTVNVEVTAEAASYLSAASVGSLRSTPVGALVSAPVYTPRLREYFPETLLWQPSLETRADGTAHVRFKLADSITTWKAIAIASTKDGRVAMSEREILASQPFFLEHDPPKLLTEGDRIALPVVVHSYLDRDQSLDLTMKPEDWFEALDSPTRKTQIKAGEAMREVFTFKAVSSIKDGKQRITALGSEASDAIEKTLTVYPLGREMTQVSSGIFRGTSIHDIAIPSNTIAGSVRAELKIYPNLMAHVADAVEGIMRRPYGCAEQTISSAYPSLLLLRYNKQTGRKPDPVSDRAMRYLQIALQILRGYQSSQGGFSYWSNGDPDIAVTAYALQFLDEAKDFIAIDQDIPKEAHQWLVKQQAIDGSWKNDAALTAYVARVLSAPGIRQKEKDPVPSALNYLRKPVQQPAAPYVTASLALAALNSGEKQLADSALDTLKAEAHHERDSMYWDLQTNTPFYSWGLPGRLETTAIAVDALAAAGSESTDLVDKGLLFLLRNKDRYGVWYSTQATVRVLEALVRLVGGRESQGSGRADVFVNGSRVVTVAFGNKQQPITLDVSKFLSKGANRVEVVERKRASTATTQLVETHYVPWDANAPDLATGPLRFSVRFDRQEADINEAINVRVEAERYGFRGYGMMLAEIGLPPGAEVDRASLSAAVASSGWDLTRYDVLPDRVIVYVWPRAGGTAFDFKFRPRYGLDAHTPASKLYDYYNPDAQTTIVPTRFTIR